MLDVEVNSFIEKGGNLDERDRERLDADIRQLPDKYPSVMVDDSRSDMAEDESTASSGDEMAMGSEGTSLRASSRDSSLAPSLVISNRQRGKGKAATKKTKAQIASRFCYLRQCTRDNHSRLAGGSEAKSCTSDVSNITKEKLLQLDNLLKAVKLQVDLSEELSRMENGIAKAKITEMFKKRKFPKKRGPQSDIDYLAFLKNVLDQISLIAPKPQSSTTPQMPTGGEQEPQEGEEMVDNNDLTTARSVLAVAPPATTSPRSKAQVLGQPTVYKRSAQTVPDETLPPSKRLFSQSLGGRRSSSVATSSSGKEKRIAIRLDLAEQDSRRMYWTHGQTRDDFFQKVQSLFRNASVHSVKVHIQGDDYPHTVEQGGDSEEWEIMCEDLQNLLASDAEKKVNHVVRLE